MNGAMAGGGQTAVLQQLLDQQTDPLVRMLMQQMLADDGGAGDAEELAAPRDRTGDRTDDRAGDRTDARTVDAARNRLRTELGALRARSDTLAYALGACPACWGDELGCEVCGGRGRPGAWPPDPELFAEFVQPALRRLSRGRARPATPDRPPQPGGETDGGAAMRTDSGEEAR